MQVGLGVDYNTVSIIAAKRKTAQDKLKEEKSKNSKQKKKGKKSGKK